MKKTLWIAMAGALVASVVAASAQEVLSANAVGYIKKTMPAQGQFVLVGLPLDSMTEASNVFGRTSIAQEAAAGSYVYFWNSGSQTWSGGSKISATKGWTAAVSNHIVAAGDGFFLKSSNATSFVWTEPVAPYTWP